MAANSVLLNTYADPGMGTPQLTQEMNPLWGDIRHYFFPVVKLASTTVDARSANTSDLLPGLVLGRITASGLYTHCLAGSSDGSQVPLAILVQGLSILDANLGSSRPASAGSTPRRSGSRCGSSSTSATSTKPPENTLPGLIIEAGVAAHGSDARQHTAPELRRPEWTRSQH